MPLYGSSYVIIPPIRYMCDIVLFCVNCFSMYLLNVGVEKQIHTFVYSVGHLFLHSEKKRQ